MQDFYVFSSFSMVIGHGIIVFTRNNDWNTKRIRLILFFIIFTLNIIANFIEETAYFKEFLIYLFFISSSFILYGVDILFEDISMNLHGKDFDFILQNRNESYFGDKHNYKLTDKIFSSILILVAIGLPFTLLNFLQ